MSVCDANGNQRGLTVFNRHEAAFANLAEAALVLGTTLEMALLVATQGVQLPSALYF